MSGFTTERFQSHINHVDEDLRLMALFDLRQHLTAAGATPDAIEPMIVQKTLACLTRAEKKEEVRQEAVSTVPPLAVACAKDEQTTILRTLLDSTTASPTSPAERPAFLELQDLCSLALKATVIALVGASQRDVAFWQKEMDTMRSYTQRCTEILSRCPDVAGKETVYATLNTLIPVFGTVLDGASVDAVIMCSFHDTQHVSAIRRVTIPCCSAIAPFATEAALKQLQEALLQALRGPDDGVFVVHVQMCEALIRSDPERMRGCIGAVADCLVQALKRPHETDESATDAADAALRVLELTFNVYPSEFPVATTEAILAICEEFAVFDPNYCGSDQAEEEEYQDEYGYGDEYYQNDYYGEATDANWKLRAGALRVLRSMVATIAGANMRETALRTGTAALQDRIQDTQLEGFSLISAVASHPRCTAALLRGNTFDSLAAWAANGGDKSSLAALKTIDTVFRCVADSADVLGVAAAEKLAAILRDGATLSIARYVVEVVQTGRAVLGAFVAGAADSRKHVIPSEVVGLVDALLHVCGTQERRTAPRAVLAVIQCGPLFVDVAGRVARTDGEKLGQRCVDVFAKVADADGSDMDCRTAAVEALGAWAAASHLGTPAERALAAMGAALSDGPLRIVVLRCLQSLRISDVGATRVPADFLGRLAGIVECAANSGAERVTAANVATNVMEAGLCAPPQEWLRWIGATSETVRRCQAAGHTCADEELFSLLASLLRLLSAGARQQSDSRAASRVNEDVVAPTWRYLAAHCGENGEYTEVLRSLVALVREVAPPADHAGTLDAVASFLTGAKAPSQKSFYAASAVVGRDTEGDAVGALLDRLRAQKMDRATLNLVMGEAGRVAPLPPTYATALLDSVRDDSAEVIRASGESGLAAAMSNAQNRSILTECLQRASSPESVKGRFYYLKALRSAIAFMAAAPEEGCSTSALFREVVTTLLAHPVEDDFVELTAACVGAVAHCNPTLCITAVSTALGMGKKELRLVCTHALRFIIPATAGRDEDASAVKAIVMSDLCNDLALTASPSVPIKTAIMRILTNRPAWVQDHPKVFQHLLVELRENQKLVGSINIGGYTHRTDKGLEMRKTAFECFTAIMESDRTRGTHVVESSGQVSDLLDALIHASSSVKGGEKEASINNEAKLLLVSFFRQHRAYKPAAGQMTRLCEALKSDFDAAAASGSAAERLSTQLTYTIFTVTRLAKQSRFLHHRDFHALLLRAQRSDLLPVALKMTPAA